MQYFVIWTDGQKFGPADLTVLNEWAAQGRITPTTELESVVDGSRMAAGSLPGMVFAGAASNPVAAQPVDAGMGSVDPVQPVQEAVTASADSFFVIGADGSKYGPADVPTLSQWAADNRLNPNSELENASTGARTTASMVPGLMFPTAAAAATNAMQPMGGGEQVGGENVHSNYPRAGGYGHGPSEDDLKKFNWGAFLLNWIWGLNHKYPMALIALGLGILSAIPLIGLIFTLGQIGYGIWLGINGNKIAWDSGRFSSVEEMHKCQQIWAKWGVGLIVVACLCGLIGGVVAAASGAMSDLGR